MTEIEKKLITEACERTKTLLDDRDMDTLKVLWKMCAYIGGGKWHAEFTPESDVEEEVAEKMNKLLQKTIEPYCHAVMMRLNDEFFKGMREGIKVGVDLANEEDVEPKEKEPKKDYAKAVERFYKAMEEDD